VTHRSGAVALTPEDKADFEGARLVTAVEIRVDPDTLDRLFVVHCARKSPVKLRVNPVDLAIILKALAQASKRSMN